MTSRHVAFYISGHGFGHGARATAVAAALCARRPGTQCHLVTDLPEWFLRAGLDACAIRAECVDVGVVQRTALAEDHEATLARLATFYPLSDDRIGRGAAWARDTGIDLIVSDSAPLGVAVGQRAGIPVVLVESFTWAFIYGSYAEVDPRFGAYAEHVQAWLDRADLHVRTEPLAGPGRGDVVVGPIARRPRRAREETRRSLGAGADDPMVLVTMGGTPWIGPALDPMRAHPEITFVVSAGVDSRRREGNVLLLPPDDPYWMPDLVAATDAVVGKAGYSTAAEAYYAGVAFGFLSRPEFPEARELEAFVTDRMDGIRIDVAALETGAWVDVVPELLRSPRRVRSEPNGAEVVAEILDEWGGRREGG